MQEVGRKRTIDVRWRARLPVVARALALAALVGGLIYVGIAYYRNRNNEPFRMRAGPPELSKQVTSVIEGYERRVMDGERLKVFVRAARDITYSDNHHELEEVHLEVYPETGDKPDQITAQRAVYLPDEQSSKKARVWFTGDVRMETRDSLKAATEKIAFDQGTEIAETDAPITFERENVRGSSTGAVVDARQKKIDLHKNVEIIVTPDARLAHNAKNPTRSRPVTIRSGRASFDQVRNHLSFTGGATAEQERDVMSGEQLAATLNTQKRVEKLEARGNSYLRSMSEGGGAEVQAADMDFFFDADQRLMKATAARDVRARSLDADSQMELTGAGLLEVDFAAQEDRSVLREMRVGGRSVLTLSAPKSRAQDTRAANKRLTAEAMKLVWRGTGKDLERAEAGGNVELVVEPVQMTATADRKTLTAPQFSCDFYETGNLAREFIATGGEAKAVITPLQPTDDRAERTLTSQKMTATFVRETQDVERFLAEGDAKFNERDRNGRAQTAAYTTADETVRLRGGEPTVWDSRARTKAAEIDSDTRSDTSFGRGKTSTTYYSQEQTNGATPFQKVKSPVYIVSDRAEFRHVTGVAVYTGNARAWQDDNFVRADTITIYRDTKRMEGEGHVQSALYQARRKDASGAGTVVPAFATADAMSYSDDERILRYSGNVDIKQDTDRIRSEVANIHLIRETNEVEKTIAERNVVVTQPGRQGTGTWAQYTAADETVVLKGSPARVGDADQGSTEGGRLTVYLRENRVVGDDPRGPQAGGRVRATHKIKKQ
ncbi:MAG TPA: LPS export ABC transporter periplasmic protein LptC [Pyrinomonadaceae bacterium]|nr:LPS export ABC transporter periplasmic protein LptC [Pyrinomonadaceae bacterium]